MKKLLLLTTIFLFLVVFIKTFIPKNTFAQSCECQIYNAVCQSVTKNNCGSDKKPSCQNGNVPGVCGSPSCVCIDKTSSCQVYPVDTCTQNDPNTSCQGDTSGYSCKTKVPTGPNYNTTVPVKNFPYSSAVNRLLYCDGSDKPTSLPTNRIYTAIGCLPVGDLESLVSSILGWAIGIGGGVAFLLIIYSGIMIMTSSGNPERLKAGQELLTSAIAGLIMLIFSVFILRVIGVDILQIPGI